MKRALLLIGTLLLCSCTASAQVPAKVTQVPFIDQEVRPTPLFPFVEIETPRPSKLRLSVPFSSQAPYNEWDAFHNDTCEEMSLLMVLGYIHGFRFTPESAETALQDLVAWEESKGLGPSITIEQLAALAEERFGARTVIHTDVSINSIERLIAEGHPVIIPAAGRELLNPYFSNGGPWYHMLVITGYDEEFFYTNDPGTSYGAVYSYDKDLLLSTIHDWTGVQEKIGEGRKVMMTIEQ